MWSFKAKVKIADSGLLSGSTDFHSHILPGVDDGIADIEQSVETLIVYEKLGIRKVWLTPHIMEDYPNVTVELRQKFNELIAAYASASGQIPVEMHLGAEYMLDGLFLKRLESDDLLPIIDGKHLLIETSYFNPPLMFDELLKRIREKGYTAILAHPERYQYMQLSDYDKLHANGIKMQLDLMSLTGGYGKAAQEKALTLLKKGYFAVAGSDIHSLPRYQEWVNSSIEKNVSRQLQLLLKK